MTWLFWLMLVGFLVAVVAVFGIQPRGARPVARTGLMTVARLVLILGILLFAYFAFRAR